MLVLKKDTSGIFGGWWVAVTFNANLRQQIQGGLASSQFTQRILDRRFSGVDEGRRDALASLAPGFYFWSSGSLRFRVCRCGRYVWWAEGEVGVTWG
jgi:hypothetical protein